MLKWQDTKKIKQLYFSVGILFVISAIILTTYVWSMRSEFPLVTKEQSLAGYVHKMSKYQSVAMVEMMDGNKYMLNTSHNYLYNPSTLKDFIQKKDFLWKNAGSDTLYVQRNRNEYFFVLGQFINKNRIP